MAGDNVRLPPTSHQVGQSAKLTHSQGRRDVDGPGRRDYARLTHPHRSVLKRMMGVLLAGVLSPILKTFF